jgi:uncharacterized protein YdaT
MALWDKVKQELDRAGEAANAMIDEGKVRHEAFRARQLADKAAQALGYAIYRARQEGKEVDTDTYARLSSTLAGHEADVSRLEAKLDELVQRRKKSERPGPRTQSGTTSEATGTPDDGASSSAGATP